MELSDAMSSSGGLQVWVLCVPHCKFKSACATQWDPVSKYKGGWCSSVEKYIQGTGSVSRTQTQSIQQTEGKGKKKQQSLLSIKWKVTWRAFSFWLLSHISLQKKFTFFFIPLLKKILAWKLWGWSDGSVVRGMYYSCKWAEFFFWNPNWAALNHL